MSIYWLGKRHRCFEWWRAGKLVLSCYVVVCLSVRPLRPMWKLVSCHCQQFCLLLQWVLHILLALLINYHMEHTFLTACMLVKWPARHLERVMNELMLSFPVFHISRGSLQKIINDHHHRGGDVGVFSINISPFFFSKLSASSSSVERSGMRAVV